MNALSGENSSSNDVTSHPTPSTEMSLALTLPVMVIPFCLGPQVRRAPRMPLHPATIVGRVDCAGAPALNSSRVDAKSAASGLAKAVHPSVVLTHSVLR